MHRPSLMRSSKLWFPLLALVLTGGAIGGWWHFHGAHGTHDHDGHGMTALTLNDGRRWATDAPLRTGMTGIRAAVTPVLTAHAAKRLTPEAARALADTVQGHVNTLFANCRLPPKADATLHVIITDLLSGAGQLAGDPGSAEGARLLAQALHRYPEYFEHPEWSSTGGPGRDPAAH